MIPVLVWLAIFLFGVLLIAIVLSRKYRPRITVSEAWQKAADKAEAEGIEINVVGRAGQLRKPKCEGCGKLAEFRCTDCHLHFCMKNGCPMFDEYHPCDPVGGKT